MQGKSEFKIVKQYYFYNMNRNMKTYNHSKLLLFKKWDRWRFVRYLSRTRL